jgi:predicted nucleic acid-binding protein
VKVLIDTNVLVRWAQADNPLHAMCRSAITHLAEQGWDSCTCAQVLIEFWVVGTRPIEVNGLGLSIDSITANLADMHTAFVCLPEPPDIADRWQGIAAKHQVVGKQAHDTRLVALMLSHEITHVVTLNPDDFSRYSEITALTPAEVLSQ